MRNSVIHAVHRAGLALLGVFASTRKCECVREWSRFTRMPTCLCCFGCFLSAKSGVYIYIAADAFSGPRAGLLCAAEREAGVLCARVHLRKPTLAAGTARTEERGRCAVHFHNAVVQALWRGRCSAAHGRLAFARAPSPYRVFARPL